MHIKEIKYDEEQIRKDLKRQISRAIDGVFKQHTKWYDFDTSSSLWTLETFKQYYFLGIVPYRKKVLVESIQILSLGVHIPFDRFGNPRQNYETRGIVDGVYGSIEHKAITTCHVYSNEVLERVKNVMNEFQKQFPELPIEFYDYTGKGKQFII